jgi:hypothetical protein
MQKWGRSDRLNINIGYVVFFHPDYTVGFGFSPNLPVNLLRKLTGSWAD